MKALLIISFVFLLTSCGNKELENYASAEKASVPVKIDNFLTLTSVELNKSDKRLEYIFEVGGMTEKQEEIMIKSGTEDFCINYFKEKKPGIMTVYDNFYEVRAIFTKKGKKLRSLTLTKIKLN